ncbi:MAG: DoxX family protein [Cytophagaceae bacterium]
MDFVRRGDRYAEEHPLVIFAVLRVLLGLVLLVKGIYFIQNTEAVIASLHESRFVWAAGALTHYIALVHIAGGIMIAIGFITRIAVLFNLPIILGAIFVNFGPLGVVSEWFLAIIVLVGLAFFLFYGSGVFSFRTKIEKERAYNERYYNSRY